LVKIINSKLSKDKYRNPTICVSNIIFLKKEDASGCNWEVQNHISEISRPSSSSPTPTWETFDKIIKEMRQKYNIKDQ